MRRILPALSMLLLISGLVAGPAGAQSTDSGSRVLPVPTGLRAGYTSWDEVSQMHFGAHAKLGDLFPNVQLVPSLEMGFGDGLTLVAVNGDLSYRFTELVSYPWELYGGGSLAFNYIKPRNVDSDFQLGLSGLVGLSKTLSGGNEIMFETRFGILDSPGFKATIGYTFF
jgi:hypothetical protein